MNATSSPSELTARPVRPADRLGFTLFVATLAHLALLLGVSFGMPDPAQLSKTLEVTLASFKSDEKPKQADYLAQHDQQGSGSLEHSAVPTTTEKALFQENRVRKVTPPASPEPPPSPTNQPKAALTTRAPQPQQAPIHQEQPTPAPTPPTQLHFDRDQLSSEIASLEADLAREVQEYAKRPRIHHQTAANTMRDISAWYRDDWRKKVERIGNQNYPDEARRKHIHGSLRLLVMVKRDGTLGEVTILESSGHQVLDQAALRIVRLAAPFAPFSGELAENYDQIEIIRTWRFERGDRLSSQ